MKKHLALEPYLDSAPRNWGQQRFRFVVRERHEKNTSSTQPLLSLSATTGIQKREGDGGLGRQAPSDETITSYGVVYPGDLVINPMWALEGGLASSSLRGAVSPAYRIYMPGKGVDSRYLHYLVRSSPYIEQYRLYIRGITTFDRSVSKDDFDNLPILLPPLNEQRCIADFLDAETARIHRLATLRTSQMETLAAYYQSRLSEMAQVLCDRYGTVKVRHVLQKIEQGWSPQCEDRTIRNSEWGVVKAGCVNGGVFDAAQHKALPAGFKPELRYRLHAGDLLMSRASGSVDLIGSIAALPNDLPPRLLLCDKVYRLRMDRTRMTPYFVAYMLRTLEVREQIKLGISGAEGMANNLPTATVTNLPLPDVPLLEQGNVVNDLNDAWQAVHNTTQVLKQQLAVLGERRQALITAAVTGKIDITTAQGVVV